METLMPKEIFIGIDPGISGAIAVLDGDGEIVQIFDMPIVELKIGNAIKKRVSPQSIVSELHLFKNDDVHAVIEQVNAMPGQGVTSMFSFGKTAGILEGILAGMVFPYSHVIPGRWKKHHNLNASKDAARELAMRTWPSKADLFKLKKHDGRAEAALIALYYKQTKK
jgi:crossover junction endodeoxyribonuclease RuvC